MPAANKILEVSRLETLAELESIRGEWMRLWRRCPPATPFQTPQWLIPWWRHLGNDDLWTVAVRREGELLGLIPLFRYRRPETGARELVLVGNGVSDYLDALVLPEERATVSNVFREYLQEHGEEWDVCDFQQLREDSFLLQSPAPTGCEDWVTKGEVCSVMNPREIPRRQEGNLRNRWNCSQRAGEIWIESATGKNVRFFLQSMIDLHQASWEVRQSAGGLADPAVQRFHLEAGPALLEAGLLRLYGLFFNERLEAVWHGFHHGSKTYFYLNGYNPAHARLSLGSLLLGHAIKESVREGASEFDFLRGQETYKKLWGVREYETYRTRIAAARMVSQG